MISQRVISVQTDPDWLNEFLKLFALLSLALGAYQYSIAAPRHPYTQVSPQ